MLQAEAERRSRGVNYADAISEADFYGPGDVDYEPEPDPDTRGSEDEEDSDE